MERNGCKDSEVYINTTTQEITGYMISTGFLARKMGGAKIYFFAKFNERFDKFGTWFENK